MAAHQGLPADLHQWDRFVRPEKLDEMLAGEWLAIDVLDGIGLSATDVPRAMTALLALKLGQLSYAEGGTTGPAPSRR